MTGSLLRLARVVLEARTPLSITTGAGDRLFDTALVRDGWGLPAIPATSLKGAVRALWREIYPGETERERDLFGYAEGQEGAPARIGLSWGVVHGADDRPARVASPRDASEIDLDPFLGALRRRAGDDPLVRQRVRITEEGVADAAGRGQFDRSVLPVGLRFTVEAALLGAASEEDLFDEVLQVLCDPMLRVGGATRGGLGRLDVVRIETATYDLASTEDANLYRRDRAAIARFEPCETFQSRAIADVSTRQSPFRTIRLEARDLWRFGGGEAGLLETGKEADPGARPLTEPFVDWSSGRGRLVERQLVVPGSGVKGALRHRTLFHYRALKGLFADNLDREDDAEARVAELFGAIRRGDSRARTGGRRGRLLIDDAFVVPKAERPSLKLMHNSIDRFSGGVREGLLFDEEVVGPAVIELRLAVERGVDPEVLEAFEMALGDLERGWLPLGAGGRSGHGVFTGEARSC